MFLPTTQHVNVSLAHLYSSHKPKESKMRQGMRCDKILDCFQISLSAGVCPEQAGPLTNSDLAKNRDEN
jgi:hypothetical protein